MPDRRSLITTLTVAGLLLLLCIGLWQSLRMRERRAAGRLAEAQAQLVLHQTQTLTHAKLQKEVQRLQDTVAHTLHRIPASGDIGTLLHQINAEAQSQHLGSQIEVLTQPVVRGTTFSVIPLTLNFHGSFSQTYTFLSRLETLEQVVQIHRVDLSGNAAKPADGLTARVELSTFFTSSEAQVP